MTALALASCVAPRAPDPEWSQLHAPDLPAGQGTAPAPAGGGRQAGDLTGLVGLGFTDGPDSFLLGGELDFYQSDRLAIGPMLRFGLADDVTMIAPSAQAKYRFPVDVDEGRFAPFVQGGAGLMWMEKERAGGDQDETGFLLHAGGGVEWQFEERMFLASTMVIDFMPDEVLGENVVFTWQLVQLGFRF